MSCLIGSYLNFTALPIYDAWAAVIFYARLAENDWSAWWEHHNEHRIILTRLLFWLEFKLWQGSGIFLIICNYGLLLASYGGFYQYLQQRIPLPEQQLSRRCLAAFIFSLVFAWMQQDNILWNFQSQFFLVSLLPLWAFYWLQKGIAQRAIKHRYFMGALTFGVLAWGTMANGILVLPLLAVLAWGLGYKRHEVWLLLLLGLLGIYLHYVDYPTPLVRHSFWGVLSSRPVAVLHYVLLYLGGPSYFFTAQKVPELAVMAGALMLIAVAWYGYQNIKHRSLDALSLALLTFISFIMLTALVTGVGRIELGVLTALTSRYTTPALQAWIALLLLYAPLLAKWQRRWQLPSAGVFVSLLLLILLQQTPALQLQQPAKRALQQKMAMHTVAMQVQDQPQLQGVFTAPEIMMQLAEHPVAGRLVFFHTPLMQEVRHWLKQSNNNITARPCAGAIDRVNHLQYDAEHLRVRGWLFNLEQHLTPTSIQILNAQRQVIGYGVVGMGRDDLKTAIANEAGYAGFLAYVPVEYNGQQIILKGMGTECELTAALQPAVVDDMQQLETEDVNSQAKRNECPGGVESFDRQGMFNDRSTQLQLWLYAYPEFRQVNYQQALALVQQVNNVVNHRSDSLWRLPTARELAALKNQRCLQVNQQNQLLPLNASNFWVESKANQYGYYAWDVLFLQGYERWRKLYWQRKLLLVRAL